MRATRDVFERMALGGLVAAIVAWTATAATGQQTPRETYEAGRTLGPRGIEEERRDSPFLTFLPQSFRVTFEDLLVRFDDRDRLVIEFEVEDESWEQLQDEEIRLWLELWIPIGSSYIYVAFPRLRDVRLLTRARRFHRGDDRRTCSP